MNDELLITKKLVLWAVAGCFVLSTVLYIIHQSQKVVHLDDAVENYEQFQEIFNTCQKLDTDFCNMKDLPEKNIMFEQFSKQQRLLTIKTSLNRWIEDYNAKSKMFGRRIWKSSELPYQLSYQNFPCIN